MIAPWLIEQILSYLKVEPSLPTLQSLDQLINAYVHQVPWESVSRMAQRARIADTDRCPRWPTIFWQQAIEQGTGGTCFESNYAFFQLLLALGYRGYLTINNMQDSIGCHTAIVIEIKDQCYLVDVGLPLHIAIPFNPTKPSSRESRFHTFTVTPTQKNQYRVTRDRHSRSYCFDLIDTPVDEASYRRATTNDYDRETGLFLDRMIIVKVIDDAIWRFNSDEGPPYHLESFNNGDKTYHHLGDNLLKIIPKVAEKFKIDGTLAAFVAMRQT